MKKKSLLILFVITMNSFAQIDFEKGYFINNNNEKIECLIKNPRWKNNPSAILYKQKEGTATLKATIKDIKEFSIGNTIKYIRQEISIDKSSENTTKLSNVKEPIFEKETLFLEVIIESEASLYQYKFGSLKRFFFNIKGSEIKQLVFKTYTIGDKSSKNHAFRQQLFKTLKCNDISINKLENLNYSHTELKRVFLTYNTCKKATIETYNAKKNKKPFNLNLKLGVNNSSLSMESNSLFNNGLVVDYGSKIHLGFGVELEYTFPFFQNKWSIFLEPTYKQFSEKKTISDYKTSLSSIELETNVNYNYMEIPIGLRHYFHLNEKSKLFINIARNAHFGFDSKITFTSISDSDLEMKKVTSNTFGVGYNHKQKYSVELRYVTNKEITPRQIWDSTFKTFTVVFGYTLF